METLLKIIHWPTDFLDFVFRNIFWFKLISNILSTLFLIGIAYCIWGSQLLTLQVERWIDILNIKTLSKRRAIRGWRQIKKRLKSDNETNFKLAILEADRIFDEILKLSGLTGETMDERLKRANEEQVANLEQLKQVHRVASRISSDPDFKVGSKLAHEVIKIYEELFGEYGLVD